MTPPILTLAVSYERDVVLARQRARQIASLLGFDAQDQTRIATAVSEIARNAFDYGQGGTIEFRVDGKTLPQVLLIRIADRGPGIRDVAGIFDGHYQSPTGMGIGLIGARRLMDQLDVDTTPGKGTTVTLKKLLPRRASVVTADRLAGLGQALARQPPRDLVDEVQQQNQELLRALGELTRRQEELTAANRELEDTNRGVVALYAELDEKAEHLRRADEIKTRFISNMSHEFRTPVNSIQALAGLLLERADGPLTSEQERQVGFIAKAADALGELVGDLLDLAKVEAGKIVVRPSEFDVASLFGALRGMLRPLLVNQSVRLVFEDPELVPPMYTDEAKVSQILRNFVSNALKFTERGEVRVSARVIDGGRVVFSVSDTGIGIAPEDHERIFQEFTQIDSALQRRVKGTGLGLPLCRRLAELLGGHVELESALGTGSTFRAVLPIRFDESRRGAEPTWDVDPDLVPLLVVEDDIETLHLYEKFLTGSGYQILPARTEREARHALASFRPRAIVLDVLLPGEDAWELLTDLKRREDTRAIPVLVLTSVEDETKALALGAEAYCVKPIDRHRLLQILTRLTAPETLRRILVVDDEEISRYVLRQYLMTPQHLIFEAASGPEAIEQARRERPDVICLDLMMPDVNGLEILQHLRSHPDTRAIPVLVVTAKPLQESERAAILHLSDGILSKDTVSRERTLAALESALQRTSA